MCVCVWSLGVVVVDTRVTDFRLVLSCSPALLLVGHMVRVVQRRKEETPLHTSHHTSLVFTTIIHTTAGHTDRMVQI